jgi:DNA-directed RNA polymerase subunit RPC12/RpoP
VGFFDKNQQQAGFGAGQSVEDMMKMAQEQVAAAQQQAASIQQATAGTEVGSSAWARKVMSVLVPPQPGFVRRSDCPNCGAPKKLPSATAYVYCDYCASLMDYDLRKASENDAPPSPEYPQTVNGLYPQAEAAKAAGDQDTYRGIQKQTYEAYVKFVPNAVSHRAKNDAKYREQYINYMAEAATARAFDPGAQALEAEMKQRVMSLQYSGGMMAQQVSPESFWPMVETLEKQLKLTKDLNRKAGVNDLDPDRSDRLGDKMGWSGFVQGWIGMLPDDAAAQLLDRTGLKSEFVAVQAEDGQPRKCGNCGGQVTALPDAKVMVCDGCGLRLDVGAAEIPCRSCGGSMTFPEGADNTKCPFCGVDVERVGVL